MKWCNEPITDHRSGEKWDTSAAGCGVRVFTGQYFHAIDAKSRLTIPAKLREQIDPSAQGYGFVAVHGFDGVLYLYPPETYRAVAPQFGSALHTKKDVRDYERLTYGLAEQLEVDRLGRVLIPEYIREQCGLSREVAVIGVRDHLEIWDRERWQTFIRERLAQHDQLAERAMALAQPAGANGAAEAGEDST